jgi:branched-subunit amino acid transport protein
VSLQLILLALLMGAVTYPSRALPLLAPGMERLPPTVLAYLRLVGPAVLATLAAVSVMVMLDEGRQATFHIGVEWVAVGACVGLVAWRRNLLAGIVAAALIVAVVRAVTG